MTKRRREDDIIFDAFENEVNASLEGSDDVHAVKITRQARRDVSDIAKRRGVSIRTVLDEMFGTETVAVLQDGDFDRLMREQKSDPLANLSLRGKLH